MINKGSGRLAAIHVLVGAGVLAFAPPSSASALCTPDEKVLFSCDVGAKFVSICGRSNQLGGVYRFGRVGKIELELSDLHVIERAYSGGGEMQVYASTPSFRYIVYSRLIRTSFEDGGRHDIEAQSGLLIEQEGKTLKNLRCKEPATFDALTAASLPRAEAPRLKIP